VLLFIDAFGLLVYREAGYIEARGDNSKDLPIFTSQIQHAKIIRNKTVCILSMDGAGLFVLTGVA